MYFSPLHFCLGILGIALFLIIITHQVTYAELCARGPYESYNKTDEVFLGQITSKEPINFTNPNMKITLDVKEVFKGKYNDTFTVFYFDCGSGMGCVDSMLEKGKEYIIYGYYYENKLFSNIECGFIRQANTNEISEVKKLAQVSDVIISPRKQMQFNKDIDGVTCKQGFVLLMKISDGSPACVKSQTAQKLVERGWGLSLVGQQVYSNTIPVKNLGDKFIWFLYGPESCKITPWNEYWFRSHTPNAWGRAIPQSYMINEYFRVNGITIMETRISAFGANQPICASSVVWYFLVSESDVNKMSKLGYENMGKETPPILSSPVD